MWARTGGRKKISFTKFFNASIVDRGNLRGPPPQWNPIQGFLRTAMILRLLRALFLVNFLGAKLYNSCPSFAFSFWRALEMPLMMVWGTRLYFFSLRSVTDALTKMTRGFACTPQHLQSLVVAHVKAFQKSHGIDSWVPKFHMSLHLPMMLEKFKLLISCFCHERNHKVIKNFANQRFDTSKSWEKGLLHDVLHKQLQALSQQANMPNVGVGLLSPRQP